MTLDSFKLDSAPCQGFRLLPTSGPPRAVIHIVHGMSEHARRYEPLAVALAAKGWAVYAHDQRGHGTTATDDSILGFFAERDGWSRAVEDFAAFLKFERQQHPNIPLVAFGHSMGSFIVQDYLSGNAADGLSAAILSGTNGRPPLIARIGVWVARFECWRLGPKGRSPLIRRLSFDTFNRQFKPNRTSADWLSRDPQEVDKYIADPMCGFDATNRLWDDLLTIMPELSSPHRISQIPSYLPVYILGGDKDPTSYQGRGVRQLVKAYEAAGMERVHVQLYPDGRHEMLNEINRNEVIMDLQNWLDTVLESTHPSQMTSPAA